MARHKHRRKPHRRQVQPRGSHAPATAHRSAHELVVVRERVPCPVTGMVRMRERVERRHQEARVRRSCPDWLARALAAGWIDRRQHESGRWFRGLYHAVVGSPWVTLDLPYQREVDPDEAAAHDLATHYLADPEAAGPAELLTAVRRTMRARPGGEHMLSLLADVLYWQTITEPPVEAMREALDALREEGEGRCDAESARTYSESL